jgi:ribosomal protein S18 acetylase RimI-like enzyme
MLHCPFLPRPGRAVTHEDIRALGDDRSGRFYRTALDYAQTLWLDGFPAKALLLVNRALSCRLPDVSLNEEGARPYHAKAWILVNRPAGRFIGNPRRHYQHLATRMVEPHKELRTWRAWACWYLARTLLPEDGFPHDAAQVREELIVKPRRFEIADKLRALGPRDDLAAWESALDWSRPWSIRSAPAAGEAVTIRLIREDEASTVRTLAHEIWPKVYPGIISMAQIDYMLADRYDLRTVQREITERGAVYALIETGGAAAGYISYDVVAGDSSLFLNKLYLKPELHGRGIGAQALRWLDSQARARNATLIRLRVNRNNHNALRAYLREGYAFEREIVTSIGGGFVMDDFLMIKRLTAG